MKLAPFIASLLPTWSRDRQVEDWNTSVEVLEKYVLPSYEAAAEHFKTAKLKSKDAQRLDEMFHHNCRVVNHNDNLVVGIYKCLLNLKKAIPLLEQRTGTEFGSEIAKGAMTYRQANLLQLQEMVSFALSFSTLVLKYVYVAESAHYPDSDSNLAEQIMPDERDYLKANFNAFAQSLNILGNKDTDFSKNLDGIPDIVVKSENIGAMESSVGRNKLDPFRLGLLPPIFSPIYHIRLLVAEWQTNRFYKAKEEQQLMQVHLLHLKKLQEGKPDAKLRQEIQYYEDQVNKISRKTSEMEKAYGGA